VGLTERSTGYGGVWTPPAQPQRRVSPATFRQDPLAATTTQRGPGETRLAAADTTKGTE
jgi:hypothetical protein